MAAIGDKQRCLDYLRRKCECASPAASAVFPVVLIRASPFDSSGAGFFGKTFGTFTDLLKYEFELLQLFRRDVLKHPFDERRVPAKERSKHLPSFFSQRHRSHPPIASLLYATDQPLLV